MAALEHVATVPRERYATHTASHTRKQRAQAAIPPNRFLGSHGTVASMHTTRREQNIGAPVHHATSVLPKHITDEKGRCDGDGQQHRASRACSASTARCSFSTWNAQNAETAQAVYRSPHRMVFTTVLCFCCCSCCSCIIPFFRLQAVSSWKILSLPLNLHSHLTVLNCLRFTSQQLRSRRSKQ